MRFMRFGAGVAAGLALGAAVPLMAQGWPYLLGPTLTARVYGLPSGSEVIVGCSNASGFLVQNSVAVAQSIPGSIAGIPYTLVSVACP